MIIFIVKQNDVAKISRSLHLKKQYIIMSIRRDDVTYVETHSNHSILRNFAT